LARFDGLVHGLAIVSTISHDARDLALDPLEQDWHLAGICGFLAGQHSRDDLVCFGVNGQVQLTPPAARPAVLLAVPFPLSEQLQAGAVDQQAQGAVWDDLRPAIGKGATTPAQGGVIGNREIKLEQPEHAAGEPFGLPQAQVEASRRVSTSSIARSE
jgi:hypothetical protein